ncbi:hypothetical protein F4805DRAFT_398209 [Annulohypoxylon moriforme]|nr:hypothetical protein F4805DRAFT_398209 [Annulohypoxylon moriforme]
MSESSFHEPEFLIGYERLVAMAPYLKTNDRGRKNRPDSYVQLEKKTPHLNQTYFESRTAEPLSDHMLDLLRQNLETRFYEEATIRIRLNQEFARGWGYELEMARFYSSRELPREYSKKVAGWYGNSATRDGTAFFNKHTAIYFIGPSKIGWYEDQRLGRYIFHRWLQIHNERPPFQRHHYFARAITFDKGADSQSIQKITSFHRSLCDRVSAQADKLVKIDPPFEHWPIHDGSKKSWRDYGYTLQRLFRAIFIVVDRKVMAYANDEDCPQPPEEDNRPQEAILQWALAECTVLLVRTGDDEHLSSPIDFQPLINSGATLAVNRKDVGSGIEGESVVRVKIDVAMHFFLDLIHREEAAIPSVRQAAQALKEEQEEGCRQWIDRVMKHAEEVGIDGNGYTWFAIRQVKARLNGEKFYKYEDFQFWHRLYAHDR